MPVVTLSINGKDYDVACGKGEEERLRMLAGEVESRVQTLGRDMKNRPAEAMSLLLTSLMMADELLEYQQKIEQLSKENSRLESRINVRREAERDARMAEMEAAMTTTIEEIASRIERIAERVESH